MRINAPSARLSQHDGVKGKCRTVFAVLLLWLAALGVAWANACLVQQRSASAHVALESALSVLAVSHITGSEDAAALAELTCSNAHHDGTQAFVRLPASPDVSDIDMAPAAPFRWTVHAAALSAHASTVALPPCPADVPLRTLLSRLAL